MLIKYDPDHSVVISYEETQRHPNGNYYVGVINKKHYRDNKDCFHANHNLIKEYCDYIFDFDNITDARKKASQIRAKIPLRSKDT